MGMSGLGGLGWAVIGAAIGCHAARRRGFSRTSGIVSECPVRSIRRIAVLFRLAVPSQDSGRRMLTLHHSPLSASR